MLQLVILTRSVESTFQILVLVLAVGVYVG